MPTGCCDVNSYDRRHHNTRCPNHPESDTMTTTPTAPQETPHLLPAESMALTAALGQLLRGDPVGENTAAFCVFALARITGRHDWTADTSEETSHG